MFFSVTRSLLYCASVRLNLSRTFALKVSVSNPGCWLSTRYLTNEALWIAVPLRSFLNWSRTASCVSIDAVWIQLYSIGCANSCIKVCMSFSGNDLPPKSLIRLSTKIVMSVLCGDMLATPYFLVFTGPSMASILIFVPGYRRYCASWITPRTPGRCLSKKAFVSRPTSSFVVFLTLSKTLSSNGVVVIGANFSALRRWRSSWIACASVFPRKENSFELLLMSCHPGTPIVV